MRRALYIYILALTLLISSCIKDEDATIASRENMSTVEQVTIMYFIGTSLKSDFNTNVSDVATAVKVGALGDGGRVFIFMQSTSYDATLYEIYEENGGYNTETIATYSDDVAYLSTDANRMSEILNEVISFASAKKYNIIISSHGSAWVPYDAGYISSTSPVSTYSNIFEKDPDALPTRYIGVSKDGIMEIWELKEALEATNTKFGYILFDMCLMSNIETIYDLRDLCDNIVASPAEVMAAGFPFQTVLPYLFTDNGSSYNLEAVCEAYYTNYANISSYATVAMCVTSELEALAAKILEMSEGGYIGSVNISSLQCYENLYSHILCDLRHYIREACTDETLLAEAEEIFDRAFPPTSRYHTTYAYSALGSKGTLLINDDNYSGVSTSAPSSTTKLDWEQTSWAQATQTY